MLGELLKRVVEPELHPWRCPGCGYDAQREKCPECGVTRERYIAVLQRERPWRKWAVIVLLPGIAATIFFLGLTVLYWNDMAGFFCLLYACFCAIGVAGGAAPLAYIRMSRPKPSTEWWNHWGIVITATIGSLTPGSLVFVQLVVIG